MENIVKKLQNEAGLTEEQAMKSLKVIKDYMDQEDLQIDWGKFFEGKYDNFKDSVSSFFNKASDKADEYGDKINDTVEDMAIKTKREARDISKGRPI